jgi:hypothetical protein
MSIERGEFFMENERSPELQELDLSVQKLTDKLGYGEGGISYEERKNILTSPDILNDVESAIQSNEILVPVDKDKNGQMLDDDGCGDGRGWGKIFDSVRTYTKSLNRSKVFGGGLTMGVASAIGLGKTAGKNLNQLYKSTVGRFKDRMIGYGAHTDTHAHDENCGCGAIDKAPAVVNNAVKYEAEIRGSIEALGVDTDGLDEIFDNYREYIGTIEGQAYSGKEVADDVVEDGKIVKELDDDHREMYIILNMVENMTVDQQLIREVSGGEVQVFAVDVWRMQQLAHRLYDDPEEQKQAFLSELVHTLAVGATLTTGDLPVYIVSNQRVPVPV